MRGFLVATVVMLSVSSAHAGRPVTDEEKAKLDVAVSAEGCATGKIEFDDGKFEVDDATCADGKKYDLDFDANYKLIRKKLD